MESNGKRKREKEESMEKNVLKQSLKIESVILEENLSNISKHKTANKKWKNLSCRKKRSTNLINKLENINGSIISHEYIPEELLIEILSYVDCESLLSCQLVCQHWRTIIQSRVWHKKVEQILQRSVICDRHTPWWNYYYMSKKMPFNTNLIKNHSGQDGLDVHWELPLIKGIHWSIENPVVVPLLPPDSSLKEEKVCFVTSFSMTWKYQIIDLIEEGFSHYLLDYLQPPIQVSEWYCSSNTPAKYICDIELLKDNGEKKMIYCSLENYDHSTWDMYDHHTFSKIIKCGEQNKWYKYEHKFQNYGQGLRKIKFIHGGRKINHYGENNLNGSGAKMARACVKLDLPSLDYNYIKNLRTDY